MRLRGRALEHLNPVCIGRWVSDSRSVLLFKEWLDALHLFRPGSMPDFVRDEARAILARTLGGLHQEQVVKLGFLRPIIHHCYLLGHSASGANDHR